MSHHKRYSASKRTVQNHANAWQQASSTISDILSDTTDTPEHYFQTHAMSLTNLGLAEFVGTSRRGLNMQGYINLQEFFLDMGYELINTSELWCNEVQNYMKRTHPWENQTGDAERGLGAQVAGMDGDEIALYLYHSVHYGHFLEGYLSDSDKPPMPTNFAYTYKGVLAVIQPTLDVYANVLGERLRGVLSR